MASERYTEAPRSLPGIRSSRSLHRGQASQRATRFWRDELAEAQCLKGFLDKWAPTINRAQIPDNSTNHLPQRPPAVASIYDMVLIQVEIAK